MLAVSHQILGDAFWDCDSIFPDDPDWTIAFIDTLMDLLHQMVQNTKDLSKKETFCTVETLIFTLLDSYWQCEEKERIAIASFCGDKYQQCMVALIGVLHYSFCTNSH